MQTKARLFLIKLIILKIIAVIFLTACSESGQNDSDNSFLEIEPEALVQNFGAQAGYKYVTVRSSLPFTVSTDQDWCEGAPDEITNNLKISVFVNYTDKSRVAKVTLSGEGVKNIDITVNQTGITPAIQVEKTEVEIQPLALEFTLNVTSNLPVVFNCPEWITEKSGNIWTSGKRTYAFTASALPNGLSSREGLITVKASDASVNVPSVPVRVIQTLVRPTYRNPVINTNIPDPSVIRADTGYFYVYATENTLSVPIYRSADLVHWESVGAAFTGATRPTWEPGGGLWAPDVNKINGKYVMYYSLSVWGGEWTCGIGIATADRPEGPFTDRGMLFRSDGIGVQNSIDPNYVEDGDRKYLFWGSFRGIYGIELSADGLSLREGSTKQQVAGTAFEGTYIHKRGNYYYLFASIGSCCNGLNSTYTVVTGRSTNLWGPYVDEDGFPMKSNYCYYVIRKNSAFVGIGHNAEIVQDEIGDDWLLYHGYVVPNGNDRCLLLDKITWVDDWPTVSGGTPSIESEVPFITP
jgi:arabinan endo-1,5-alpha-L-arabinosidase